MGFFFQAEDGIRDLVRSRGLGDVYKRQGVLVQAAEQVEQQRPTSLAEGQVAQFIEDDQVQACLLYTSDAADERSRVDLGGRRIIKKKKPTQVLSRTD